MEGWKEGENVGNFTGKRCEEILNVEREAGKEENSHSLEGKRK